MRGTGALRDEAAVAIEPERLSQLVALQQRLCLGVAGQSERLPQTCDACHSGGTCVRHLRMFFVFSSLGYID